MAPASVLICEDSGAYAAALRRTLEYDGDINVISVCGSAEEAITVLRRCKPDLITMDIELPGMDGLAAVELIMGTRPMPIIVLSSHVGTGSAKAAAALAAGALDALAKDDLDLASPAGMTPALAVPGQPRVASVVGVCSSAGGPPVLSQLLGGLPAGYQVPILVVQHISTGFTESLARWLDQKSALHVRVAADGDMAGPGAWIAPEGAHLVLTATGRMSLDRTTVLGHHRPSGDMLFMSIASSAGRRGAAVVLTGMGNDGAAGAAAVHDAGGLAITQDEASSAIYGMPKAAFERGVDLSLPPDQIIKCLLALRHQPIGELR